MTPAMIETLQGPAGEDSVKEALRAAFLGIRPRDVYALVLHRLEGMTMREVQAALVSKAKVGYVSSRTARILRTTANDLRPSVSPGADKKGDYAKADLAIVRTLKRGCPRSRRTNDALRPRP
jgi:hypothetical protein